MLVAWRCRGKEEKNWGQAAFRRKEMKFAYEYAAACLMVGHTMAQGWKMACCMQPYFVFEGKLSSSDCN